MKYLLMLVLAAGLSACDQKGSMDSTKDRARAEEEAGREVDLKNQAQKAQKMEADLADRHYFYGALEGEYEGSLTVGSDTYNIKVTLARSLPPYTGSRVRELSEIESDLNNLFFHMQVVQWHPDDQASAVGCRISGIRPNLADGALFAASSDCPNFYTVLISEGGNQVSSGKVEKAKSLAQKISNKEVSSVAVLVGAVQPSSNALKYPFNVKRVQ